MKVVALGHVKDWQTWFLGLQPVAFCSGQVGLDVASIDYNPFGFKVQPNLDEIQPVLLLL